MDDNRYQDEDKDEHQRTHVFVIEMSKDEDGPTAKAKLTLSYVHNTCSFPFQHKTVAQSFDELAAQYPDYECYIFKGVFIL